MYVANGNSTQFVYDRDDLVLDVSNSGTSDYLDGEDFDEKLRQSNVANGTLYFIQDHLYSTNALTAIDCSVAERVNYEVFGATANTSSTRFTYTGRELDSLTDLIYYRTRWYDAKQGRFLSEDPIIFSGGMNFYSYVDNNSISFVDPFGLQKLTKGECNALREKIIKLTNKFFKYFKKYADAGFFDKGNKPLSHRAIGSSKSGGHVAQMDSFQRGLWRDIPDYIENCLDDDDPPPPFLEKAFEAAKHSIPKPKGIKECSYLPGQSPVEVRFKREAAEQYYEFWRKVSYGGAIVSVGLLGGAILPIGAGVLGRRIIIRWPIPAY
jgi:RHS repeat-associated protein